MADHYGALSWDDSNDAYSAYNYGYDEGYKEGFDDGFQKGLECAEHPVKGAKQNE